MTKENMGIRIYLDLAGLERLIGGNTEAEVEIREGVVRTFAKKHLKELANSAVFGQQLEKIRTAIEAEFKTQIPVVMTESPSWKNQNQGVYQLLANNPTIVAFKQKVADEARQQLQPICDAALTETRRFVEERFNAAVAELKGRAEEIAAKHFDLAFKQLVRAEVERRLKDVAKSLATPEVCP
jgi:hypothetical protein